MLLSILDVLSSKLYMLVSIITMTASKPDMLVRILDMQFCILDMIVSILNMLVRTLGMLVCILDLLFNKLHMLVSILEMLVKWGRRSSRFHPTAQDRIARPCMCMLLANLAMRSHCKSVRPLARPTPWSIGYSLDP